MSNTREPAILITGCGGGVGQSVLKCFQGTGYRVTALDAEPLGAGLYAAPHARLVPYANDPEYGQAILDICRQEPPGLLFPGLDAELPVLAQLAEQMRATGVIPVVSPPEVIDISDDKLATAQFLQQHGFPAPVTVPLSREAVRRLGLPLMMKPRTGGARSQGVFTVRDAGECEHLLSRLDASNYVAQEYIDGDEYTCGSITFDGRCRGVILMRRVLRDGDTYKAFVVRDEATEQHVCRVAEALGPFGPCNFQLRIRDGAPYIFEINARCSGTSHARALAGFNEPLMTAAFLLNGREPVLDIQEIAVLRYWSELVVDNREIAAMRAKGAIEDKGRRL